MSTPHLKTMSNITAIAAAPALWGGWFSLAHCNGYESLHQLPAECVADCSGPGPADEAVSFWVDRLGFDGPSWLFRSHLREFGCWDGADLADHRANCERVLWTWACSCSEDPGVHDYLWLGV